MIKKILLAIAICLGASPALAQTEPFSTYVSGLAPVGAINGSERMFGLQVGVPKTLTPYQILGIVAGDCTIAVQPTIICIKTNGVAFAPSATIDTTNASNITSGTLANARSAAVNLGAGNVNGGVFGTLPFSSLPSDPTNASNLATGTAANARLAAINLAAGNVNGGVFGALPFTNFPTGSLDTSLGYFGSITPSAVSIPNCVVGSIQYSTTTHTWSCNAGVGSGTVTSTVCDGVTITTSGTCPARFGFANCAITATVASNNLTVALKNNAGADPTVASPCSVWFRSATAAPAAGAAQWVQRIVTAATSFVANAGSTFGISNAATQCEAASSCPFRLHVVLIDTGATAVLGVVALTNLSGVLPLNDSGLPTSNACSACTTATTLGAIYSTVTQTTKPIVYLGYMDWGSGLAVAGTYASGPTFIQTMGHGVKKPGDIIQAQIGSSNGGGSATTSISYGTGPAPTNAPNVPITLQATPNLIRAQYNGSMYTPNGIPALSCRMFRGPASALNTPFGMTGTLNFSAGSWVYTVSLFGYTMPGTLTQQFFTVRVANSDNANTVYCPQGNDSLEVTEIQG